MSRNAGSGEFGNFDKILPQSCHVGGFDDFGECGECGKFWAMANLAILTKSCHSHDGGEFGKISPNSQINANKLNTWKPAMLVGFDDFGECDKLGKILSKCQIRQGYQQSGAFDEYGKFGEYGEFDDISPRTKIQANELKTRVSTKRQIRRIRRIWRIWRI